jgi:hypothetical protein
MKIRLHYLRPALPLLCSDWLAKNMCAPFKRLSVSPIFWDATYISMALTYLSSRCIRHALLCCMHLQNATGAAGSISWRLESKWPNSYSSHTLTSRSFNGHHDVDIVLPAIIRRCVMIFTIRSAPAQSQKSRWRENHTWTLIIIGATELISINIVEIRKNLIQKQHNQTKAYRLYQSMNHFGNATHAIYCIARFLIILK